MSREQLQKMTADALAAICKEKGIAHYKGKTRFRKNELIEAILKEQKQPATEESVAEQSEEKIENASVAVKAEEATGEKNLSESKERYLQNITIGTLVAFREYSGKLNTAAVQNISFKRRQLRLVTQYNKEYIVSFDDIVWIRTKKRWPRFVLNELKQRSADA